MVGISVAAGLLKKKNHLKDAHLDLAETLTFGSFTLEEREGNPEPNYWFDSRTNSSYNAIGLKNQGLKSFLDEDLPEILMRAQGKEAKICISLAPTKTGDLTEMGLILQNHRSLLANVKRVEVNAACPNHRTGIMHHPVLAKDPHSVTKLLEEFKIFKTTPIFLKVAPNTDPETLEDIVVLCVRYGVEGIVSGNTQLIEKVPQLSVGKGGMGGAKLLEDALVQVRRLRALRLQVPSAQNIRLVGCGGIMDGKDVDSYARMGADEVQIATYFAEYGARALEHLHLTANCA